MEHYADDLAAVIARLDVKDAVHVGHSTGGGEVVRYAGAGPAVHSPVTRARPTSVKLVGHERACGQARRRRRGRLPRRGPRTRRGRSAPGAGGCARPGAGRRPRDLVPQPGRGPGGLVHAGHRQLRRPARGGRRLSYGGIDLYGPEIDAIAVRKRIGMVFQRPNPKSIYDNVAFGPRVNGYHGTLDEIVEQSLERGALWDEVKDRLRDSALALSGGQQQRLVIARALAVEPDIILMDEPASALDPKSTRRIEDVMRELTPDVTIVIVTHNLQQAGRIADLTAFLNAEEDERGRTVGRLVEFGPTKTIFTNPSDQRTEAYVSGEFG